MFYVAHIIDGTSLSTPAFFCSAECRDRYVQGLTSRGVRVYGETTDDPSPADPAVCDECGDLIQEDL